MQYPKKVLFMSAPFGSGHLQAAHAVAKALESRQIETRVVNVFDFFNPLLGKAILKSYLKILDIIPGAYGRMYGWGDSSKLALFSRDMINSYFASKMLDFITEYKPRLIVCTHATPAGLVSHMYKRNQLNVPSIGIITDFVVHRWWIYPEISHYFVAHEQMQEELELHSITKNQSTVSGIPIDKKFTDKSYKEKVLKELPFTKPLKTVLIMGGGAGVLPMEEIVKICDSCEMPLNMIVVTGNNQKLYRRMRKLKELLHNELYVLPFVHNVNELMAASDLLITKPGGMTSSEALCMGLPMLIYRPIPGQEEANTKFLLQKKVALRADSSVEIKQLLSKLFEDNSLWKQLQQNALLFGKPQATEVIAQYIAGRLDQLKQ